MSGGHGDTIFALSSGRPPAALAIIRISGPHADAALAKLSSGMPPARRPSLRTLTDPVSGDLLDTSLVVRFPAPNSATGEDIVELHLHGGRAVVSAVEHALGSLPELRLAQPGEFTRRAFENGRLDLAEAEGLAYLLAAETESQRRAALALAGGKLSRQVEQWRQRLLALAAQVEALLDFADDLDDDDRLPPSFSEEVEAFNAEVGRWLSRPHAERLKDGVRVVVAGPANAGKSTLLNALAGREAAITSPIAGTTRDIVEAPVAIAGLPLVLVDTAGLRHTEDTVERIGVERAQHALASCDIILWLGDPQEVPDRSRAIIVAAKADLGRPSARADLAVSVHRDEGVAELVEMIRERAAELLPSMGEMALNQRHATQLRNARNALNESVGEQDLVLVAEHLRRALVALDQITGKAGVEDMLDALFGRFCIGK